MYRTLIIPRQAILRPRYPIRCKTLIFSEISKEVRLPVDASISVENLVFHDCDRYFVYSALSPSRYNNLKNIFINSHPRHRDLFVRVGNFEDSGGKVYLHEKYSPLLESEDRRMIKLLSEEEYQRFYLGFLKEAD